MKKLLTLVLTLALCVPMLLTTSFEVRANNICAHSFCGKTVSNGQEVCSTCENKISFYERVITSGSHIDVYLCSACNSRIHQNEEPHNQNGDNGVCSVCGYNTVHQHSSNSSTWFRNSIQHWRICNAEICNVKVDEGEHNYTEKTPTEHKCGVCGYNAEHVDGDSNGACDKCGYNVTNSNDGSQGSNTPQPSPNPDENTNSNNGTSSSKKQEEVKPVVIVIPEGQKYTDDVIEQLSVVPTDGKVVIDTNDWYCFNRTLAEKVTNMKDVTVTIKYKYQGKRYEVVIPSGSDIVSLLDENGFVGFRYLDAKFGGREL